MNFDWEISCGLREGSWVAGIDEVGRGPIAGPVLAAAVVFPPRVLATLPRFLERVRDSKKLQAGVRESLDRAIRQEAFVALGAASVADIERCNILHASMLAMQRAYARLHKRLENENEIDQHTGSKIRIEACLVDGNRAPELEPAPRTITPIVGGDGRSLTIACASIVAKVARDRMMQKLHRLYPCYAWHENKGYPVPRHLEAVKREGLSKHHRKTFAPCRALLER